MGVTVPRFIRIPKAQIPTFASDGVPYMTSDTDEIFVGTGVDTPLKKLNIIEPIVATIDVSTTSFTFSNLDVSVAQGYTLVTELLSQNSAYACYLYFNDNFTNNKYTSQKLNLTGTTWANAKANNASFLGTNANNPAFAIVDIDIINGYPVYMSREVRGTLDDISHYHGMLNTAQSNITSITITAATANGLKAGSKFSLYRRT